jgi:histidine triad (HIT) family protein
MTLAVTCLFCDGAHLRAQDPARVVYEDDRFYVTHPLDGDEPTYLGSLMTVTKRDVPSFAELTFDEAQALGLLLSRVSRALKVATGAGHAYAYFFGEGFNHLHVFTVARYDDMPADYVRLDVERWPEAPRGDAAAVEALCAVLRADLRQDGPAASSSVSHVPEGEVARTKSPLLPPLLRASWTSEIVISRSIALHIS